jgi:hypothetical protein
MGGWMRKPVSLLVLAVFLASLPAVPSRARAQSADEDSDTSDSAWESSDDTFSDGGEELGPPSGFEPAGPGEEEPGAGGYVNESGPGGRGGAELTGRTSQLRRGEEAKLLPQNLGWGAATGLVVGGWLALLNQGSNRANLQSIGTGIVVGSLLGIAIGARFTINPEAPVPQGASNQAQPAGPSTTTPLVAFDSHGLTVGVLFQF